MSYITWVVSPRSAGLEKVYNRELAQGCQAVVMGSNPQVIKHWSETQ